MKIPRQSGFLRLVDRLQIARKSDKNFIKAGKVVRVESSHLPAFLEVLFTFQPRVKSEHQRVQVDATEETPEVSARQHVWANNTY